MVVRLDFRFAHRHCGWHAWHHGIFVGPLHQRQPDATEAVPAERRGQHVFANRYHELEPDTIVVLIGMLGGRMAFSTINVTCAMFATTGRAI